MGKKREVLGVIFWKDFGKWGVLGVIQVWAERIYFLYPRIHHNPGMFERGRKVVKGIFIKAKC